MKDNTCGICGGVLRVEYVITFDQCKPRAMRVESCSFSPGQNLCPGHDTYVPKDVLSALKDILSNGLHAEGGNHKQYALCQIAKILGLEHLIEEVEERGIP